MLALKKALILPVSSLLTVPTRVHLNETQTKSPAVRTRLGFRFPLVLSHIKRCKLAQ